MAKKKVKPAAMPTEYSESEKIIHGDYKDQHALNVAIERLIDMKGDGREYSDEEKLFLNRYSGAGGLAKKGASGKGLLYEYYTPDELVKKMWALAQKYGYSIGPILEPSVGIGRFLKYAPPTEKVVGYETNIYSAKICSIIYPNADIRNAAFETNFFNGRVQKKKNEIVPQYNLVIGNPPYGDFGGKYAGMGEEKATGAKEYDQYFILRGLDLLSPGGILCFVIPSTFLKNGEKYNKVKKAIVDKADLVDSYRLPMGVFDTTEIGTDIVVFKKKDTIVAEPSVKPVADDKLFQKKLAHIKKKGTIITFKEEFPTGKGDRTNQLVARGIEKERKTGGAKINGRDFDSPWFNSVEELIDAIDWDWMTKTK